MVGVEKATRIEFNFIDRKFFSFIKNIYEVLQKTLMSLFKQFLIIYAVEFVDSRNW